MSSVILLEHFTRNVVSAKICYFDFTPSIRFQTSWRVSAASVEGPKTQK